jgi:hypothetical protein
VEFFGNRCEGNGVRPEPNIWRSSSPSRKLRIVSVVFIAEACLGIDRRERKGQTSQKRDQDVECNIDVVGPDRFGRIVADAAAAAHKQHGDRAEDGRGEAVMARTERRIGVLAMQGLGEQLDEARIAARGRFVIGPCQSDGDTPALGNRFEAGVEGSAGRRAGGIVGAAKIDREALPGMTLTAPGTVELDIYVPEQGARDRIDAFLLSVQKLHEDRGAKS